jgi:hypothetical protein
MPFEIRHTHCVRTVTTSIGGAANVDRRRRRSSSYTHAAAAAAAAFRNPRSLAATSLKIRPLSKYF